jgi:hypothetical protein
MFENTTKTLRLARGLLTAMLLLAAPFAHASAQDEGGTPAPEGLSVSEMQLGTSLASGVVETPATTFSRNDGRLYAVIRVENPASEATSIRVSIEPVDGAARPGISLDIPARRRYRTVARFSAHQRAGRYRVVVRSSDGTELSSTELTITE